MEKISSRQNTGPIRIDDDWAGIFIRGDDAFSLAITIRHARMSCSDPILEDELDEFAKLLDKCQEPVECPKYSMTTTP